MQHQIIPPTCYLINAVESERHLLSWMLNSQTALNYVAPYLTEELFDDAKCKEIAKIFISLIEQHEDTNWQMVVARLNALEHPQNTMLDVADLMQIPGSSTAPIKSLLKTLDMYRRCRAMVRLSMTMWMTGTRPPQLDTQEEQIQEMLNQFDEIRLGIENPVEELNDCIDKNLQTIQDNQNPETRHTGMLTGFHMIDDCGGLPTGMTVLGAKSSHGKSAMAMAWALNAAKSGMKVAFLSLEMLNEELSARALAMQTQNLSAQVPANSIMRVPLKETEMESANQAAWQLRESGVGHNILLSKERCTSFSHMELMIRQLVTHYDVKAVFIDYLQLINVPRHSNDNREQIIGHISHTLQSLAVDLKIYVIVMSQVNRNVEGEPNISHLRDSGQIAEAADSVAILWRPEQDHIGSYNAPHQSWAVKGTGILKMEKFRNGPTGECLVQYTPHLTRYDDLPEQAYNQQAAAVQQEVFTAEDFKREN